MNKREINQQAHKIAAAAIWQAMQMTEGSQHSGIRARLVDLWHAHYLKGPPRCSKDSYCSQPDKHAGDCDGDDIPF